MAEITETINDAESQETSGLISSSNTDLHLRVEEVQDKVENLHGRVDKIEQSDKYSPTDAIEIKSTPVVDKTSMSDTILQFM